MRRTIVLRLLLGLALVAACAPPAPGPAARPAGPLPAAEGAASAPQAEVPPASTPPGARAEPIKIGFANVTAVHAGLWAAQESGAFERQGLAVELANLGSGQTAQAALITREVFVASVGGSSTIRSRLAGADLIIIGALFDTMPYQLASGRAVATVAELRGKTLATNRFGGAGDTVLRYLLRQAGLDPERDVTIIQVGSSSERLAALRSGAVQATLMDPPFTTVAEREGLRVLVDTAELDLPYPQGVLAVQREWLAAHRDTARRLLQATAEGLRAFRDDRDLAHRTLRRWLQVDDPALLDETAAYYARYLPEALLPRPEGLQFVIDEVANDAPQARSLRPEDLVDPTLAASVR